jgi:hypothetical protein
MKPADDVLARAKRYPYAGRPARTPHEFAAEAVLSELHGRTGFRDLINSVRDELRPEIVEHLALVIRNALATPPADAGA